MDVLPELGDGAGEVGGVLQGVVGEAAVGVPGVPAALPRQVLGSMHTVSTTSAFFQTASPLLIIYLFQRGWVVHPDGQELCSQRH